MSEYGECDKHFLYHASKKVFDVKKDYKNYDTSPDDELQLSLGVCEALLNNLNEAMYGVTTREKKIISELQSKLLGDKRGNLYQYQTIILHVMMCLIPQFEHTMVVEIVEMSDGEYVLVCLCRTWEIFGWAYWHIFAVLKRYLTVGDAKISPYNDYAHKYGHDKTMSQRYLKLRDKFSYTGDSSYHQGESHSRKHIWGMVTSPCATF